MKKFLFYCLSILLLFSGCSQKITNWGKKRFNQGCKIENDQCVVYQYIRTTKVYDQFRTLGIFNAMWLSDVVRRAYVNLHAQKFALSEDVYKTMLVTEELKTKNSIAFYILSWYPKWCGAELDKPNTRWLMFLKVGDKAYTPKLIKRIDLPCEYVIFFNKLKNNFKKSYYVEFDAEDENGNPILDYKADMILCFRSYETQTYLKWEFDEEGYLKLRHHDEVAACHCYDVCSDCKNLNVVK